MNAKVRVQINEWVADIPVRQAEKIAHAIGWVPPIQVEFQPGDYVEVRDNNNEKWLLRTFHSYSNSEGMAMSIDWPRYRVHGRVNPVPYRQCQHAHSWAKPE